MIAQSSLGRGKYVVKNAINIIIKPFTLADLGLGCCNACAASPGTVRTRPATPPLRASPTETSMPTKCTRAD